MILDCYLDDEDKLSTEKPPPVFCYDELRSALAFFNIPKHKQPLGYQLATPKHDPATHVKGLVLKSAQARVLCCFRCHAANQ